MPADRESPGHALTPASSLHRLDGGRVLYGGNPRRLIRLSDSGADRVNRWVTGAAEPSDEQERAVARRLVDAGLFHPCPQPASRTPSLGVVIPVKDDEPGVRRTLAALLSDPTPDRKVVVVDDGSARPVAVSDDERVTIVRYEPNRGPAFARNAGRALIDAEVVAFVDAGVILGWSTIVALARWFSHPWLDIGAVAPRVTSAGPHSPSPIDAYEAHHSPLDMGGADDRASLVGPGRPVSYVPTTALLVRRTLTVRHPFDETLRYGEDVDFSWRLSQIGVRVLFDPTCTADHPARRHVGGFARQRFFYGRSSGALADRHGALVSHSALDPADLAVTAAALFLPVGAAVGAAALELAVRARIGATALAGYTRGLPGSAALGATDSLTATMHRWLAGVDATVRPYAPLTVAAIAQTASPRLRRRALLLLGVWLTRRLARRERRPVSSALLGIVDDTSYTAGVWAGTIGHSPAALLSFGRRPRIGRRDQDAMNKSSSNPLSRIVAPFKPA